MTRYTPMPHPPHPLLPPIEIERFPDVPRRPVYVRYTNAEVESTATLDLDCMVSVDLDADEIVVGIQLVLVDDATVDLARSAAEAHGLAFPELAPSPAR